MTIENTPPTIDWEASMKTTESNARIAAKMTERAVAALAKALDTQHRHSQQLSGLERAVEEIRARPAPPPNRPSSPTPRRQRLHPLPLIVAFVAGAAFVGFFGSW